MKKILILSVLAIFAVTSVFVAASETEKKRTQTIEKAVTFLRAAQSPNGAFSPQMGVGPTAVVLTGLLDAGTKPSDPMVKQGLDFLKQAVREDGGVYSKDGSYQNYETCIAIMCFAAANKAVKEAEKSDKGPYDELLAGAKKYLLGEQYSEQNGTKRDDPYYGGAGYGKKHRPDLSNTQFFVEALRKSGTEADDPAIQNALVFISRCQNLESEHNTLPMAAKTNDGGFFYTAAVDTNPAGTSGGGLRSYASMTYAGLKSMIYAGLDKDDKRIKAAYDWAKKNYDLQQNPGMGQQGLFYYYQTFAKALSVMSVDELEDAAGKTHRWKEELVDVLATKQQQDGSWVNTENDRWMEGDPNLVTGYILMALADCQ